MEEDSRPLSGDTTPLGTSRDWAKGRGRQGGGVVHGLAEEGWNLEGITHRGSTEC